MANCQPLFEKFIEEISLTDSKKSRMKTSKDALRKRIRKYFEEHHPEYIPKFYIQGSKKMKSVIRTKDDICDLDDGVYFFRSPDVSGKTLQGWVWDAIEGYTSTEPEHRRKCLRQLFAGDYEIDYPVYYKIDEQEYKLAVKDGDYEDSDPKAMVNWFVTRKDKDGRLIFAVKELKAWCDYKPEKMPSGLAMTILATNAKAKIVLNERADITLRDILKEIKKTLETDFKCDVPAVPYDNLFENYTDARRQSFMDNLTSFIEDADKALQEPNQLKSSRLWRRHLGNRFPEGEDKNEQTSSSLAALAGGAATSFPYGA